METVNLIMPSTNMVALDNNWKNEAEEAILISEKQEEQQPKRSPFIEANTNEVTLEHLKMIASYLHFLRIMRYVYHINVS